MTRTFTVVGPARTRWGQTFNQQGLLLVLELPGDETVRQTGHAIIEQVKNDLEEDPQLFNQTWLQDFTYISECDKDIMVSEEENYIREMVTENSENEIFENEEDKKKWIDEIVKEKLKEYEEGFEDPINYFVNEQGMFSVADLMTQSWINIDVEKAAEDAVQLDGWPHFLSHYDGEYEETENGLIIFRDC